MEQELKHWLSLSISQRSIKSFFEINKIETIALYGGGILGNLFYQEVIKFGVKVDFCIDRELNKFHNYTVVRPDQLNLVKDIDLIVVCVSHNKTNDILCLLQKTNIPSITLMQLLEICYYKELIIPFCQSRSVTPYILSWPYQECLHNLSAFEKALASIYKLADYYRSNPVYFGKIYDGVDEYCDKYINDVFTVSPTIKKNGDLVHSDITSKYVNIINGMRFTNHTPTNYSNTIYILGQCVAFGYGVDDSRTIASRLQKMISEASASIPCYRVVNLGVWGIMKNNNYELFEKLQNIPFKKGDIVIFFNNVHNSQVYLNQVDKYFSKVLKFHYYDTLKDFSVAHSSSNLLYFDEAHLSHRGMNVIAESIFKLLIPLDSPQLESAYIPNKQTSTWIPSISAKKIQESMPSSTKNQSLDNFLASLKSYLKVGSNCNGAVVMNCNPFTKGHRHLIETSAAKVDFLYIFVVEENASEFPFKDRFELVKLGTADLTNIVMLPSGRFIVSAVTFPEYFIRSALKDVFVDSSKDVEIFAQKIAPVLGIKKRFVAQEPYDPITRQYHQTMKDILPTYGIDLIEIERYGIDDKPISASHVRKFLENRDWGEISKLVPDTTLNYLQANRDKNE